MALPTLRTETRAADTRLPRRPWLTIRHFYLLIPLIFIVIYGSLSPTPPNDFWWYLRVGQIVSTQGTIPTIDQFTWTLSGQAPQVAVWLAAWLLYQLHQLGGVELIVLVRNLLLFATLLLVGIDARWRSNSWPLAGLAVLIAGGLSLNNLILRPQMWSWLPFVLFVFVLTHTGTGRLDRRWLAALPALMVFWVNTHGAFVLGLLLIGACAVGDGLRWLGNRGDAEARQRVVSLIAVGLATGLATLVTPLGLGMLPYMLLMTRHPNQNVVVDWLHPTLDEPINRLFYGAILVLLVVLATSRRRPPLAELLALCGLIWLAWTMQRSVTWFGLLAGPLLVSYLPRGGQRDAPAMAQPQSPVLNGLLLTIIVAPLVMVQPWLVTRLPLPEAVRSRVHETTAAGPLLAADTPIGATDYLRRHPGGRLFNELGYGSYLAWALPDQPVFFLPHVESFPPSLVQDYIAISNGRRAPELLASYGADRVLLSLAEQRGLSEALAATPAWTREYADQQSEIWRRI